MTDEDREPLADGRMSFSEAVAYVRRSRCGAFAVTPVFEEDQDAASGARVFVLDHDGRDQYVLRYIAGPFFSAAYAANERYLPSEIPERVRDLRFLPTRCEEDWFTDQVQLLIQKLVRASGAAAPHMPDYENAPRMGARTEVVFPLSFVGRPNRGKD
jgi:hypothetical protein